MKKSKAKYIVMCCVLAVCATGLYGYLQYTRKVQSLTHATPQAIVTSAEIVAMYDSSEAKADSTFLGKVIEVSGKISSVNNMQDTIMNVLLGDSSDMHRVSCLFGKSEMHTVKNISVGNNISIKGICTGFLLDVELNRCVLVQH